MACAATIMGKLKPNADGEHLAILMASARCLMEGCLGRRSGEVEGRARGPLGPPKHFHMPNDRRRSLGCSIQRGALMLSDLRRRKLTTVFNALDFNGNGVVERADYTAIAEKLAVLSGWDVGSDGYAAIHGLLAAWWERTRESADVNDDGIVTSEEFYTMVETADEAAVEQTGPVLFDTLDSSGEGVISPAEYRIFGTAHAIAGDTDELFVRLDTDGDGQISRDEFTQLWLEFVLGEDESAAGNWLYGEF